MTFAEGLTGFMLGGAIVGAVMFFRLKWFVSIESPDDPSGQPKGKKGKR